jgi:putative glutamine amidotransferase
MALMTADTTSMPRVGIPYRTKNEEITGNRYKFDFYVKSVERAGGEAVPISLRLTAQEIEKSTKNLDAVLLTGSPADVNSSLYHAPHHSKAADPDSDRERIDFALLDHAFAEHKPVLAICYGIQSLNTYLGGSLFQHISAKDASTEVKTSIPHPTNEQNGGTETTFRHEIEIEPGSRLAQLAGGTFAQVNSSHHQAIREPGRKLRVVAHAKDGVIEAVEWTGDSNWVTGVQWHPERMPGDPLAEALFSELLAAARKAVVES